MKDNNQYYGTFSRLLHWLMAAAFALMLFTAVMWNINEDYFSLMGLHKSVGVLLMVLLVVRMVWSLLNRANRPECNAAAKLGHLALYALMFAVPFVGLLRQYGSARSSLEVFGIEVMGKAPEKVEWMAQAGGAQPIAGLDWSVHGLLAYTLFALVAGHIVMAVIHQLKGEKILNRMAGSRV
ncbi:MAG: cytochrome b/b6 domain-containing protein [Neisseria sp.]|nr:cytochrome b/b6 domain-containing protein [Neisseria sp.]